MGNEAEVAIKGPIARAVPLLASFYLTWLMHGDKTSGWQVLLMTAIVNFSVINRFEHNTGKEPNLSDIYAGSAAYLSLGAVAEGTAEWAMGNGSDRVIGAYATAFIGGSIATAMGLGKLLLPKAINKFNLSTALIGLNIDRVEKLWEEGRAVDREEPVKIQKFGITVSTSTLLVSSVVSIEERIQRACTTLKKKFPEAAISVNGNRIGIEVRSDCVLAHSLNDHVENGLKPYKSSLAA